jgi:hypothetical protein
VHRADSDGGGAVESGSGTSAAKGMTRGPHPSAAQGAGAGSGCGAGGPAGPKALREAGLRAGRNAGWRWPAALAGCAAGPKG